MLVDVMKTNDVLDLKILMNRLSSKSDKILVNTVTKIQYILCKYIELPTYKEQTVLTYDTYYLNIYIDLKVGLYHLSKTIAPPYLFSKDRDKEYHNDEALSRFTTVLNHITQLNYIYGITSTTINYDLFERLQKEYSPIINKKGIYGNNTRRNRDTIK